MSANVISPLQLRGLTLVECEYNVNNSPAETMNLALKADGNLQGFFEREDEFELSLELNITADLADANDGDDVRLHSSGTVDITVAIDKAGIDGAQSAREYLRLNAVSIAYSHIRSVIMTIAGLSPVGSFVLPPVLPQALVDDLFGGQPQQMTDGQK